MNLNQTFYVVKDTVTGEILEETKASGFARPALYTTEASASRARGQRASSVSIQNPEYNRGRAQELHKVYVTRGLTAEERVEYNKVSEQFIWVPAPEGRFVVVPVTISEVINGKQ